MIDDAATTLPKHALTMGIVHHQHTIKFTGDLEQLVQWCDVAIHAEYAIGDDQGPSETGILAGLDLVS